jgi:hypothetical protein
MANPMGWIDGPKTLEWYMETNAIPKELMAVLSEDEDITAERAELQGKKILAGEPVPGIAGEPELHKKVHVDQLRIINKQKAELEKSFEEYPPELMEYMIMSPQGQQLQELDKIANMLATHLMEDDQPKAMEVQGSVQSSMPQQPEVPMPPGLTPAGGQPPAVPAGGNQQSGMQPEVPPQGRPPMAEAGI